MINKERRVTFMTKNCNLRMRANGRVSDETINGRWNALRTDDLKNHGLQWYCVRNDGRLLVKCATPNLPIQKLEDPNKPKRQKATENKYIKSIWPSCGMMQTNANYRWLIEKAEIEKTFLSGACPQKQKNYSTAQACVIFCDGFDLLCMHARSSIRTVMYEYTCCMSHGPKQPKNFEYYTTGEMSATTQK